jgi:acylphosphatase
MSQRLAIHVTVAGRVQGVGFRYHLQRAAQAAGLDGWCRNRYDGTVEAVLAGSPSQVELVLAWCRHGPAHAEVSDVTVERDAEDPGSNGFRIR